MSSLLLCFLLLALLVPRRWRYTWHHMAKTPFSGINCWSCQKCHGPMAFSPEWSPSTAHAEPSLCLLKHCQHVVLKTSEKHGKGMGKQEGFEVDPRKTLPWGACCNIHIFRLFLESFAIRKWWMIGLWRHSNRHPQPASAHLLAPRAKERYAVQDKGNNLGWKCQSGYCLMHRRCKLGYTASTEIFGIFTLSGWKITAFQWDVFFFGPPGMTHGQAQPQWHGEADQVRWTPHSKDVVNVLILSCSKGYHGVGGVRGIETQVK